MGVTGQTDSENRRIQEIYDSQARWFDAGSAPGEWLIMRSLRRRLLRDAFGDVLEIGVGSGASLPYYPRGCRITGIDLSEGMLERARRRAGKLGLDATFEQGDAKALPFEDGAFDTCVSQLSLCTVPDPLAALRELRRVCRPDGWVLLLEHTTSLNAVVAKVCVHCGPALTRSVRCHPNRPVLEFVKQAGLVIEREERRLTGIFRLVWARP